MLYQEDLDKCAECDKVVTRIAVAKRLIDRKCQTCGRFTYNRCEEGFNPETCEDYYRRECEHDNHEDCMHCCVCGQCREDLDSTETCMDCGGVDENEELQQEGGSSD